ncbi:MAG TPA: hypothetical protein VHO25_23155 [Polyangiaceae bacterium]|nr:hypothetical protein [Polyangiaceae bacterium]
MFRGKTATAVGLILLCGCVVESTDSGTSPRGGSGSIGNAGGSTGGANGDSASSSGGDTNTSGGGANSGGATSNGGANANGGVSAGGAAGSAGAPAGAANFDPEFDPTSGACIPKGPQVTDIQGVEVIYESEHLGGDFYSLAMHDGWFYWSSSSAPEDEDLGIRRRAPGSTENEMVVPGEFAWGMFVTDTHLYWVGSNLRTLMRAPLAQLPATPEQVREGVREAPLLFDQQDIYFVSNAECCVFKWPIADAVPGGSMPTPILTEQRPADMALAGEELLYMYTQDIWGVPLAGGTPHALLSSSSLSDFAATADTLYLAIGANITKRPLADPTVDAATPLAFTASTAHELLLDGDRLYYRGGGTAIGWVKTDGSDCRVIAHTETASLADHRWVMDDTHVYLIEADQRILKIPK